MGLPEVGRLLPPGAVVHARALLLPLIYCSPLPQTKPRLPRLLSEVACQLRLGGGGRGGATEQMEPAFTSPSKRDLKLSPPTSFTHSPISQSRMAHVRSSHRGGTMGLSLQPPHHTAPLLLLCVRCRPGQSNREGPGGEQPFHSSAPRQLLSD